MLLQHTSTNKTEDIRRPCFVFACFFFGWVGSLDFRCDCFSLGGGVRFTIRASFETCLAVWDLGPNFFLGQDLK